MRQNLDVPPTWAVRTSAWVCLAIGLTAQPTLQGAIHSIVEAGQAIKDALNKARTGKIQRALLIGGQVAGYARKASRRDPLPAAQLLEQRSRLLLMAGRYVEAESDLRAALTWRSRVNATNDLGFSAATAQWIEALIGLGRRRQIEAPLRQCENIRLRLRGPDSPEHANTLRLWAEFDLLSGDLTNAWKRIEASLQLCRRRRGPDHPELARTVHAKARIAHRLHDAETARRLFEEARRRYVGLFTDQHPETANHLVSLARMESEEGNRTAALNLLRRSTNILSRTVGANSLYFYRAILALGDLQYRMDKLGDAERNYQLVLTGPTNVVPEAHPFRAVASLHVSYVYRSVGDYALAQQTARRAVNLALRALPRNHRTTALAYSNLGSLLLVSRSFEEAEDCFLNGLKILEASVGRQNPDYAYCEYEYARCLLEQQRREEAMPLLLHSLAVREAKLDPDHPAIADSLNTLALELINSGDIEGARRLAVRALEITIRTQDNDVSKLCRRQLLLGRIHLLQTNYAEAYRLSSIAAKKMRAYMDANFSFLSERQQMSAEEERSYFIQSLLWTGLMAGIEPAELYDQALLWKGAAFTRHARQKALLFSRGLEPQLQRLRQIQREWSWRTRQPAKRPSERRVIDRLWNEKQRLETMLVRDIQAAGADSPRHMNSATLRRLLPPHAALVDYVVLQAHSLDKDGKHRKNLYFGAFVVRRDQPVRFIRLGRFLTTLERIEQWRQLHQSGPAAWSAERELAGKLKWLLWTRLMPAVGDATMVINCPIRGIERVPLAALPGREKLGYLIEDLRIARIPAAGALGDLLKRANSPPSAGMLLVGNVDYGPLAVASNTRSPLRKGQRGTFAPIPGTAKEIKEIQSICAAHVKPFHILDHRKATEDAVARWLPGVRYAHFATHGIYEESLVFTNAVWAGGHQGSTLLLASPELRAASIASGIALAGVNRPGNGSADDGVLTTEEISGLSLRNLDLAVLSACESGLGINSRINGLYGLRRAFHSAGASSVVASLWRVDDYWTRLLMARFYRNLFDRGMNKIDALAEAQLELLRDPVLRQPQGLNAIIGQSSAPRPNASPYYWAAFVLSGAWK